MLKNIKIGNNTIEGILTGTERLFKKFLIILLSLSSLPAFSQSDTTYFSYQDFYNLLIENHPVVKMANLQNDEKWECIFRNCRFRRGKN